MVQLSKLTTVEKEIALASIEKWVRDYSVNDLTVLMSGLIMITHANCGQKEDSENIDLTIDELISDLKKYNPNISFQEIKIAFTNGYKGMYGEWFGLNNKTYFSWINGFTWSRERQRAKELLKPVKVEKEKTEEEKLKIIHDGCLLVFEKHKKEGWVEDIGNVNYNYLDSLGVFQWAKGRKFEFLRQAQDILRLEQQNALEGCKDKIERDAIRKRLDEVNNAQSERVKSMAKRIALNEFFKSLVEVGEELSDRLTPNPHI